VTLASPKAVVAAFLRCGRLLARRLTSSWGFRSRASSAEMCGFPLSSPAAAMPTPPSPERFEVLGPTRAPRNTFFEVGRHPGESIFDERRPQ
jgi:hypothetical protein